MGTDPSILPYDTQAGGYDSDGNYYLYDDMEGEL